MCVLDFLSKIKKIQKLNESSVTHEKNQKDFVFKDFKIHSVTRLLSILIFQFLLTSTQHRASQ
jgi:uncharacterized membrane protein (DUF106 family)